MLFIYKAKNKEGGTVQGTLETNSKSDALSSLQQKGYFITSIKEQNKSASLDIFKKKVPLKDKIIFTKQLGMMIRSGLSIIEALKSLNEDSQNSTLKTTIDSLIRDVEGGIPLSEAMAKHKSTFDEVYINMVKSGEKSGKVDIVMERLTTQLEKDYELSHKVKSALSYPIFILVTMLVVISLILVLVIPQLKSIFDDAGVALPPLTRGMIATSMFLKKYGIYILALLIILATSITQYKKTKKGKKVFDSIIIKLPIINILLKKSYIARFTRTFAALSSSGLPLLDIFESSAKVIGNVLYEDEVAKISKKVENGESLSSVFKKSKYFPGMVSQLVLVGEKSGQIDEVFDSLADFYEREVDDITSNLGAMLEPVLMVVMGIGIGLVIVSVLQPIYGLVNAI